MISCVGRGIEDLRYRRHCRQRLLESPGFSRGEYVNVESIEGEREKA